MTRHRFDPFSFIAGGVTVGVAIAVLFGQVTLDLVDLRIAGPVLVLVLGLALLLSGGRDRNGGAPTPGELAAATPGVGPRDGARPSTEGAGPGTVADVDAHASAADVDADPSGGEPHTAVERGGRDRDVTAELPSDDTTGLDPDTRRR